MDAKQIQSFERLLSRDASGRPTPRLVADARRLIGRVRKFVGMSLCRTAPDLDLISLACYALQLPLRQTDSTAAGKFVQLSLRQRADQSAALLVNELGSAIDETMLDRVVQLLLDLPTRDPPADETRLLADAVNLDDFGLTGFLATCVLMANQGHGIDTLIDGARKRDAYGYWAARLRDGFHFPPVRAIAERRLAKVHSLLEQVDAEIAEDQV